MGDDRITDLWFVTADSLEAIAQHLGIANARSRGESYWEWVIGPLAEQPVSLNITRTHRVPAAQTNNRIFVHGGGEFSEAVIDHVIARLGVSPVHAGRWRYRDGNDYDLILVRSY